MACLPRVNLPPALHLPLKVLVPPAKPPSPTPCLGPGPRGVYAPRTVHRWVSICFFTSACRPVLNAPANALRSAASHEDRGPRPPRLSIINTVSGMQDVVEEIDQSTPSAKLHCNKDVKNQLDRTLGSSELEWELGWGHP